MNEDLNCCREKYWKEKTIEEKVETLRNEIKLLGSQNGGYSGKGVLSI